MGDQDQLSRGFSSFIFFCHTTSHTRCRYLHSANRVSVNCESSSFTARQRTVQGTFQTLIRWQYTNGAHIYDAIFSWECATTRQIRSHVCAFYFATFERKGCFNDVRSSFSRELCPPSFNHQNRVIKSIGVLLINFNQISYQHAHSDDFSVTFLIVSWGVDEISPCFFVCFCHFFHSSRLFFHH